MKGVVRKSFKNDESPERTRYTGRQVYIPVQAATRTTKFDPKDYLVAECSERDIEIFKQIFDFFDTNDDGMLTPLDLRKAMLQFGGYNPKKNFVYQMMSEYDTDESGEINFREFVKMMTLKPCMNDSNEDIRKVFNQIDYDQKGYISPEDLKSLAEEMREDLTEEEISEIIRKCDPNGKGMITWEAFLSFNRRKTF